MPINLEWQNENGDVLATYDGPLLGTEFVRQAGVSSACLQYIDLYGDTTFNQQQIDVLAQELSTLNPMDEALKATNIAVQAFLESARGQTHTYVKFIGD